MALQALWLSMKTTGISALLSILMGLPAAYLLARHEFRGKEALDTLIDLPLTAPPVVAGVALLLAFGRRGLIGRYLHLAGIDIGFTTLAVVMAQTFVAGPLFVKSARAGFESVENRLELAARSLGANRWRAFLTVTLPLSRPSLIAGAFLTWARALSEFGATMMFAGNFPGRTQTLTLAVMTAMESDLQTAVAISALLFLIAAVALIAAKALARRWSIPLA
jgi:molybdate transport system permease protein